MGGAHVLERPVRMHYDPELYFRVTSTMYRYFAIVGGPIQVLALIASAVLAWLTRARPGFAWTLAGTLFLALSLILWFLRVQPVNDAWLEAMESWIGGRDPNAGVRSCIVHQATIEPSFPRKRESMFGRAAWIPVCAGMTAVDFAAMTSRARCKTRPRLT